MLLALNNCFIWESLLVFLEDVLALLLYVPHRLVDPHHVLVEFELVSLLAEVGIYHLALDPTKMSKFSLTSRICRPQLARDSRRLTVSWENQGRFSVSKEGDRDGRGYYVFRIGFYLLADLVVELEQIGRAPLVTFHLNLYFYLEI